MSIKRTVLLSAVLWLALMAALNLLVRQWGKLCEVRWGHANR